LNAPTDPVLDDMPRSPATSSEVHRQFSPQSLGS
jgi:hypothetical protein